MVSKWVVSRGTCLRCRGVKLLCGLTYCPLLITTKALLNLSKLGKDLSNALIEGSTPPSVYISWRGYPRVLAAIAVPPTHGDTSHYELSEGWIKLRLEEVTAMRLSLIRAASYVHVNNLNLKFTELLRDIALSERSVDTSVKFLKPPKHEILFDPYVPPMGPLGIAKQIDSGNTYFGRHVEKVFNDTDLRARDAIVYLYRSSIPVSRISRVLSVGALGLGKYRRLVPTRWAITATDKIISDYLLSKIKMYDSLSEVYVFTKKLHRNLFMAILIPSNTWMFEWLEAWSPNTTWNRWSSNVVIEGDYEGPKGRESYPEIGGCYYASRLALTEYLERIRRKCAAVLIREVYSGFNINIGVWFVREAVRELLRSKPLKLSNANEVCKILNRITELGCSTWVNNSIILSKYLKYHKLDRWSTH